MQTLKSICFAMLATGAMIPSSAFSQERQSEAQSVQTPSETSQANPILLDQKKLSSPAGKRNKKLFTANRDLKVMMQRAKKGDIVAMIELAKAYETGSGLPMNREKAFALYKASAEGGYLNSMYSLGRCYENAIGTPKDLDKAVLWYTKAAEGGMYTACRNAGRICKQKGGLDNLKKAAEFFEKGAKNYLPSCIYELGLCYQNGSGVEKDAKKAAQLMRNAAIMGVAEAELFMAKACQNAGDAKGKSSEALEWYTKAALHGQLEAKIFLAQRFENGDGVMKSPRAAFAYYLEGAQGGDAFCMEKTADYFMKKTGLDAESNPEDAFQSYFWYRKAVEQGRVEACYGLGKCFEKGVGIDRNFEKAFEQYKKYAALKTPKGFFALGRCYEYGIGTPKLAGEMFNNYLRAAELKYADAYAPLGACFDQALGTTQNELEAAKYFHLAADNGDERGVYNLALYYYYGKGQIPSNPQRAAELLEKVASKNRDAMLRLVEIYSDGIIANRRKADHWKSALAKFDEETKKSVEEKDGK